MGSRLRGKVEVDQTSLKWLPFHADTMIADGIVGDCMFADTMIADSMIADSKFADTLHAGGLWQPQASAV